MGFFDAVAATINLNSSGKEITSRTLRKIDKFINKQRLKAERAEQTVYDSLEWGFIVQ